MKKAYIVLGMHRSNTSLVAGCLHAAGVDFGKNLIEVRPDNPTGFWELQGLNLIHDRVLRDHGLSWDSPGVVPQDWLDTAEAAGIIQEFADLLRDEFSSEGSLIGLKDPRMCRFVPIWRFVMKELGLPVRWVFVIRHPEAVAASLNKRTSLEMKQGLALWGSYNLNALADLDSSDEIVKVVADRFLNDPVAGVVRILGDDFPEDQRDRVSRSIHEYCRPDLRHHWAARSNEETKSLPETFLFDKLVEKDAVDLGAFQLIRSAYEALGDSCRDLVADQRRLEEQAKVFARGKPPVVARFYPMDAAMEFSEWDVRYAAVAPLTWSEVSFECDSTDLVGRPYFRLDPANQCGSVQVRDLRIEAGRAEALPISLRKAKIEGGAHLLDSSDTYLSLFAFAEDVRILLTPPDGVPDGRIRLRCKIRFEARFPEIKRLLEETEARAKTLSERERNLDEETEARAKTLSERERNLDFVHEDRREIHRLNQALNAAQAEIRRLVDGIEEGFGNRKERRTPVRYLESLRKRTGFSERELSLGYRDAFLETYFPKRKSSRKAAGAKLTRAIGVELPIATMWEFVTEAIEAGWLNPAYYLAMNADVAESGANPLEHYFLFGWREGRRPSEWFDTKFYLASNADVVEAGYEPVLHYFLHGRKEGRSPREGFLEDGERVDPSGKWVLPQEKTAVAFFSGEPGTPGHSYRVEHLMSLLPKSRYACWMFVRGEESQLLAELSRLDWIWIWRAPMSERMREVVNLAKEIGVRIHYDLDDLMIDPGLAVPGMIDGIRSMGLKSEETAELYSGTLELFLEADQASAPTTPLVGEMSRFYIPTLKIPNGFTSEGLIAARKASLGRINDGKIRIGYACGSRTHQRDFRKVVPALVKVMERYPEAVFTTFPEAFLLDEFPELRPFSDRIERRLLVPVSALMDEYARFDINLAPVEVGNRFCEAKSEIKFFEAALVGTPTIASPTVPFRECIRNGENGFLAVDEAAWEAALESLVGDAELRGTISERAREECLWKFGPHSRSLLVDRALRDLERDVERLSVDLAGHLDRLNVNPPSVRSGEFEIVYENRFHSDSRVTVVIPLFNYGHYLMQALDSVARQGLAPLDIVIVDDRSTDDSVEVANNWLQEHAKRFGRATLLRHRTNMKLGATRNTGIRYADTEYIFPLDPDNWIRPECLELLTRQMDNSLASAVYPDLEIVGTERSLPLPREWHPLRFISGNYIDAMALIRKSVWSRVDGYVTDPELLGWEDFDFWCRLVDAGLFANRFPFKVAVYRAHSGSMLSNVTNKTEYKNRILQKMEELHPWLILARS